MDDLEDINHVERQPIAYLASIAISAKRIADAIEVREHKRKSWWDVGADLVVMWLALVIFQKIIGLSFEEMLNDMPGYMAGTIAVVLLYRRRIMAGNPEK